MWEITDARPGYVALRIRPPLDLGRLAVELLVLVLLSLLVVVAGTTVLRAGEDVLDLFRDPPVAPALLLAVLAGWGVRRVRRRIVWMLWGHELVEMSPRAVRVRRRRRRVVHEAELHAPAGDVLGLRVVANPFHADEWGLLGRATGRGLRDFERYGAIEASTPAGRCRFALALSPAAAADLLEQIRPTLIVPQPPPANTAAE